tara:strand:- start:116 stop:322 length:207 start_codon:yes stop_codon:yes gene_type:complete
VAATLDIFSQTMVVHFHAPNAHMQHTKTRLIVPWIAFRAMYQQTPALEAKSLLLIATHVLWDMKITVQ